MLNNNILNNIKNKDPYLYSHINEFYYMHNSFKQFASNLTRSVNKCESIISNKESIVIAGNIIESFSNQEYIEMFNNIKAKNNIIFEKNVNGSRFKAENWNNPNTWKLIIDNDNYKCVIDIIHEFIHYTNALNGTSLNRDIFGEFISIYFEKKAEEFLLNSGLSNEDIDLDDRLFNTYNLLTMAFEEKKDYFDLSLDEEILSIRVDSYFKHLLGLLLSEWTINNNIEIEKIIYLNNNLNTFDKVEDILKYLGIKDLYQLTNEVISLLNNNLKSENGNEIIQTIIK